MNKKIIGIIMFSIIALSIFCFPEISFAEDDILGEIGSWAGGGWDIISNPVGAIVKALATTITTIAFTLLQLGARFLSFIIGEDFLGMGMSAIDQNLITYGWEIVRDMANIVIALAFVIVGLGIILGLENFQAKKALPTLIIIALLINFTPAICWFIIDITNVVISSFLTSGISLEALNIEQAVEQLQSLSDPIAAVTWAATLSVFAIGGFVIMLLYALLFIARYFALWVLIIVSPIAFAAKAIPSNLVTNTIFPGVLGWTKWWEAFIQWNAVGIIGGFFLYLGIMLVTSMTEVMDFDFLSFGTYFQIALPFIFLYIGFFVALESSAFSAVSGTMGKVRGNKAYTKVVGGAKGVVVGGAKKVGRYSKDVGARGVKTATSVGGLDKKIAAGRRTWHTTLEKGSGKYGAYDASQASIISEKQKAYTGRSDNDIKAVWNNRGAGLTERVAAANELINRKEVDTPMIDEMATLQDHGLNSKDLLKFRPDVADKFKKDVASTVGKIKASDAHNISPDALKDIKVVSSLNAYQGASIYKNGSEHQRKNMADSLGRGLDSVIAKKVEEMKKLKEEGQEVSQEVKDEISRLEKQREENRELLKDIVDHVSKK